MSCADVERADVVAADAAFFAAGALTVAVVVKNGDVRNDDFNKIII